MTKHQTLDDLKTRASETVRRLNPELFGTAQTRRQPQGADAKPAVPNEPLATTQGAALYASRCLVRITSYRCGTPVDVEGLCGKYFVDALRYARIIHDDRPEDIDYEIRQRRVAARKEERTEIEVIPLLTRGLTEPCVKVQTNSP